MRSCTESEPVPSPLAMVFSLIPNEPPSWYPDTGCCGRAWVGACCCWPLPPPLLWFEKVRCIGIGLA